MKIILILILILLNFPVLAKDNFVFIGFGEIPVLSNSFKPSLGIGKKYQSFEVGSYFQFRDSLQRDSESFNADFGQSGLTSSKENVGARAMLQAKWFPLKKYYYLTLAAVFNEDDVENMWFEKQPRLIGNKLYDSDLNVKLTRKKAIKPAFGFGFVLSITKNIQFTTDFTMDLFTSVPDPQIKVTSSELINEADLQLLVSDIEKNFKGNFHNRHHIFNMGVSYLF